MLRVIYGKTFIFLTDYNEKKLINFFAKIKVLRCIKTRFAFRERYFINEKIIVLPLKGFWWACLSLVRTLKQVYS